MCGIVGSIGSLESQMLVPAAIGRLKHRGPDSDGIWADRDMSLGHCRLAIIDLTKSGGQPMTSTDGRYVVAYNGEIYNFREVALRHSVQAPNDTRVFTELWARHGPDILPEFNGMFAAAVWDRNTRRLHLVRDRLGVKPMYYMANAESFVFGSEARSVAGVAGAADVRESAVSELLVFGSILGSRSWFTGLHEVPPGAVLTYTLSGAISTETWWRPRGTRHGAIGDLLADSVRLRLISDVPLGVFLSGGLDSGLLAVLARQQTPHLTGLTISFSSDEFTQSEADAAQTLCSAHGISHRRIHVDDVEGDRALVDWLQSMDQPSVDGLNTFIVSRAAREIGLTVALSGLGGDELFGGYSTFKFAEIATAVRRFPGHATLIHALKSLSWEPRWPELIALAGQRPSDSLLDYLAVRCIAPLDLVSPDAADAVRNAARAAVASEASHADHTFRQTQLNELSMYLRSTLLRDGDVMSMRQSVEVRFPLLDYRIVETGLAADPSPLSTMLNPKASLRSVTRRLDRKIGAGRKRGFAVPLGRWLRGPLTSQFIRDALAGDRYGRAIYGPKRMLELQEGLRRSDVLGYRGHWQLLAVAIANYYASRN